MGRGSLSVNTTGDYNTALGFGADVSSNNLSNATAIGANTVVSASNSLVLGSGANVGIGTSSPGAKLDIAGDIKIVDGTQGAWKVLTSDVNGLASWQTPPGGLYEAYVMVSDKKASGANCGLFISGSWQRRTINTEDADPQNIASISGNQITLAAGTYIDALSHARPTRFAVIKHAFKTLRQVQPFCLAKMP